ncbi:hypothetical protein TRIP_B330433 [uncultured Desulfatiglans sp.]|nr:hypothetical protein TRIP_B330433 [uncultured Desulfatiglans sp.]
MVSLERLDRRSPCAIQTWLLSTGERPMRQSYRLNLKPIPGEGHFHRPVTLGQDAVSVFLKTRLLKR